MAIVAELFEHIVGTDTHARTHTYCLIACATGAVVDTATFPTTKAGHARAINWIGRRTRGTVIAAVEGTSSYGAGITAALVEAGLDVAEVRPAARTTHAHAGKSDALDAQAAARAVLGRDYDTLARPRQTGQRAALRVLLASRSIIDQQRTANRNALTALLRSIDLGVDARNPITDGQIRTIASWRVGRGSASADALVIARREARRLALAVLEHGALLKQTTTSCGSSPRRSHPGCRISQGSGPSPPRSSSAPTPITAASARKPPSPCCVKSRDFLGGLCSAASPRSQHHQGTPPVIDCRDQVTANSTVPSTSSCAPV